MGIDINISGLNNDETSQSELYDGLNHIDIYIEGLKNIPATFIELTDTPNSYNDGMFLKSSTNGIVYVAVDWQSMQDDIRQLTNDLGDARDDIQTLFNQFTIMESNVALIKNRDIKDIYRCLEDIENNIYNLRYEINNLNASIHGGTALSETPLPYDLSW